MDAFEALGRAASAWGAPLSKAQLEQARRYLDQVLASKANVTADESLDLLALRHFADGMAAVCPLRKRLSAAPRILDLGSGAGFIGVAIKIAWPDARVTLMERVERKFRFLNKAATELGLAGLRVARAPAQGEKFDAVVARALAPLPEALKLALPLAGPAGLVAAYQTNPPDTNAPEFSRMLERLKASHVENFLYRLPGEDQDRCLAVFRSCIS